MTMKRGRDSSGRITARGMEGGMSRVENWSLANIAPLEWWLNYEIYVRRSLMIRRAIVENVASGNQFGVRGRRN